MDFLIGRQPIFDQKRKMVAYELLFRGADGAGELFQGTLASNQVILDALLQYGLPRVIGDCKAFINFTRDNLLEGTAMLLPKDRVVIEILEDVEVDAKLIAAVQRLHDAGYTIALDDFAYHDRLQPLLPLTHIVKLDVMLDTPESLARNLDVLRPYDNIKLLAEKVETEAQHQQYRDLGCRYFQGYFFEYPKLVGGKRVDGAKHAALMLLAEINKTNLDFDRLCQIIARDVGLSYKLLRYINSAYFNLSSKVESISRAVMLLGLLELKRWASLIALSQASGGKSDDLVLTALVRGKMCEHLAKAAGVGETEAYFLAGLMSVLDRLLEMPMEDVLQGLPLTDKLLAALLHRDGELGDALACSLAYELWNIEQIHYKQLDIGVIGEIFLESVDWANNVAASLQKNG
ncbi:MAG: HDOD domain-containing protein [Methylococcaceae bacterium]|nr:MAG: HDOD domain-containing protein [Methylococcaceae bacterium]